MLHNELVDIPDEYLCPITQVVMQNPVVAADGQTYEKEAIVQWLKTGHNNSPLTGEKLQHETLTDNIALKKVIQDFQEKLPLIQKEQQIKTDLKIAIELREQMLMSYIKQRGDTSTGNRDLEKELALERKENEKLRKENAEMKKMLAQQTETLEEQAKIIEELLQNCGKLDNMNNSMRMSRSSEQCTVKKNGMSSINQKAYDCFTCNILGVKMICEACVRTCHAGHNTTYKGVYSKFCDCMFETECCKYSGPCTYEVTGTSFVRQPLYLCQTCETDSSEPLCGHCAKVCHKGHKLVSLNKTDGFCHCSIYFEFCNVNIKHNKR